MNMTAELSTYRTQVSALESIEAKLAALKAMDEILAGITDSLADCQGSKSNGPSGSASSPPSVGPTRCF